MEPEILNLFGLTLEKLAIVSGLVYFLVEAAKGKFPKIFLGGIRTDILAVLIAFGASFKMYGMQWETVIYSTIACFLIPVGYFKAKKNGGK